MDPQAKNKSGPSGWISIGISTVALLVSLQTALKSNEERKQDVEGHIQITDLSLHPSPGKKDGAIITYDVQNVGKLKLSKVHIEAEVKVFSGTKLSDDGRSYVVIGTGRAIDGDPGMYVGPDPTLKPGDRWNKFVFIDSANQAQKPSYRAIFRGDEDLTIKIRATATNGDGTTVSSCSFYDFVSYNKQFDNGLTCI